MKNLTKKERHEAYKWALENIGVYSKYLCNNFNFGYWGILSAGHNHQLKEFLLFEPTNLPETTRQWFGGVPAYSTKEVKEHQKTILEFCIEMTK